MAALKEKKNIPKGWNKIPLGETIIENNKSTLKVGDADNIGARPFFTSGEKIYSHSSPIVDGQNIFMGTGGIANIKFFDGEASYSTDTYSFKAKEDTEYLYYFLLNIIKSINNHHFSGSGLKHLQKNDFKKDSILLPPIKEQKKIADILKIVDEEIEKTDEIIVATEKLRRGLMQQLFARGIGHTKFKKTKIGEIPIDWEAVTLSELFKLTSGKFLSKKQFISGEYSVYGGNGISGAHNEYFLEKPTIIIGRVGEYCGAVYLTKPHSWVTDNALYIEKYYKDIEQIFLYYLLFFLNLNQYARVGGQPSISQDVIGRLQIGLPSLAEQKKIEEILSLVDEKISINKKLKEKFILLKNGLMQDLLNGNVRVKV